MRIENQVERRWLTLKGLRIHCLAAGETDAPVLLLHGVGLDSASLAYGLNIGPLSRYFKVFAPDWPGYGERDKPAVEYTTEFFIVPPWEKPEEFNCTVLEFLARNCPGGS